MDYAKSVYSLSLRACCRLLGISRSVYNYQPDYERDNPVVEALSNLVEKYPRYSFPKLFVLLKRKGYHWNHKRVHRVYCKMKLNSPEHLLFKDYAWEWYNVLKNSKRVTDRTLLGYKSHLTLYLVPFFGELSFDAINAGVLDEFVSWARRQRFKNKTISNKTINKCMVPLKMICKRAAIRFNWGRQYDPFFAYTKLGEEDNTAQLNPFDVNEQQLIISVLPKHWKPYFQFAFCSGLRQGEQMALKAHDIDWTRGIVQISRAMTLDEQGRRVEGKTKNKYSRRQLQLIPVMRTALQEQLTICEDLDSEYLFCTTTGGLLNRLSLKERGRYLKS